MISPSRPFIQRPVATSLFMFALLLSGILAYRLLPVSALPEVDYPTIRVVTNYPGAGPLVMTSSVTAPLERQFGQMPGLNQMTSSSSNGTSVITLQFALDMTLDVAEQEVQAAINAASTFLPNDLPYPPIYNKVNPADTPILTLALTSKTLPLREIEDIADTRLAQKIAQVSGVGLVNISGGQRPAIRIQVNPTALSSYGISMEDIRSLIVASNVNLPKGNFDGQYLAYTINANDQILDSKGYQSLVVTYRNGAAVKLSDVATVIDSVENNKLGAWMNETPAIILNIQKQPGTNVIAVADRIKQLLPVLTDGLPNAISVQILSDRTNSIRASVNDAQSELIISVCLVVLVIFLFLRNLPATTIPSISVPLSLIGSLGIMYLLGFSLNNLTLMALTIATGFVVDDAIVMIENIARYIEQKVPPLEAAIKGATQIGFTIISLTFSLIAVLIPLLFMSDVIGRLFREFALTLSITILLSAIISLTLTPMMCAKILRYRSETRQSAFEKKSGQFFNQLIQNYGSSLQQVLKHQPLTLFIALLSLILTLLLFILIPKGFFPIQDTGLILGISEAKQSISFEAMSRKQNELVKNLLNDPAVFNIASFVGVDNNNVSINRGRLQINLKPIDERNETAEEIIFRLQDKVNEVMGAQLYFQPIQDISIDDRISPTQYQYSISSANNHDLILWTQKLVNRFKQIPSLRDVVNDIQNDGLSTFIHYDRETASRLGISAQTIDDTLYDAYGQRQISTIYTQINQYKVVLEVLPEMQSTPNDLNNLYIKSTLGSTPSKSIPFAAFSKVSQSTSPLVINRQGQFPVSLISFNLAPGATLGDAVTAIKEVEQELNLPLSVQTSFEGAAKAFQNSLKNEGWLMLAAIIVVYIVLGILYESIIHPITILSTLPSACIGALLGLYITGQSLTVIALIGIILLVGIVMKNAIMMIDFALEQERIYHKTPLEAIYSAAILRFRPIIMTTFAALLGALPLAFASGMGAELRRPLGIAIVGGLLVSQILTLYTTPVIYLAFDRLAKRFSRAKGKTKYNLPPNSSLSGT